MKYLVSAAVVFLGACSHGPSEEPEQSTPIETPPETEWGEVDPLERDPGRVTLHRLNRDEMERTLQSLLATELSVADGLPADGTAHGFDNNALAQSFSALHLETIESAVDRVLEDALRPPVEIETIHLEPESDSWSGSGAVCQIGSYPFDECIGLWYSGTHSSSFRIEESGTYTFRAEVCQAYNEGFPVLAISLNSEEVMRFEVTEVCKDSEVVEEELELEVGLYDILLSKPDDEKMVAINWLEFEGPLEADGSLPPGRQKLYHCDPEPVAEPVDSGTVGEEQADLDCAQDIVEEFMAQAWRRPVEPEEVDDVMAIFDQSFSGSGDVHEAIFYAMKRSLLSPWFLFRVEVPVDAETKEVSLLSPHELATRLSYFLWSRHPDAELRALADDGSLLEDEVLRQQVSRMMVDEKAEALIANFAEQWLGVRSLEKAAPDSATFPDFNTPLQDSMALEMLALARRTLTEDRSMMEILTATDAWLEPDLAAHYGVTIDEAGWTEVEERSGGGLLTSAGFLTGTSNPTRTSPVRRGYWVITNLLCEEPPPPPDGVEQDFDESGASGTVQEQLESHRADPACAVCHDQLDPIGLALERFDGVGALRETYSDGSVIETSGTLPNVGSFENVVELAAGLSQDRRVERCMMQKVFTYGLGRRTSAQDWPYLEDIELNFRESEHRFSNLVTAIVLSDPFRSHRGEVP